MVREALTLERLRDMTPGEATAYFVSRGAEGLSASEQDLLADWLSADPTHGLAFDRAQHAWRSFDAAEGDEILAAMRAHARLSRPNSWQGWPRAVAAAAMLIVVVGVSLMLVRPPLGVGGPSGVAGAQVAWTHYETARGEVRHITLPDGTVMTLDTESVAEARLLPAARAIRLEHGRAFFDVAHDATRPFAVAAADRSVVALGTRFEVDTTGGRLSVSLFRGKVAIHPVQKVGQTVMLDPGQRFVKQDGAIKVSPISADGDPAWLSGLIEFDNTPLGDAVKQIDHYSRAQIVVSDAAVAAIQVSGQFRSGDAERFARTVTEVYPVKIVRHNDRIELVSAK